MKHDIQLTSDEVVIMRNALFILIDAYKFKRGFGEKMSGEIYAEALLEKLEKIEVPKVELR